MVAQAHHHRGNLRCFHEKIICVLFAAAVLLPPPQSGQTIRYVDDAAQNARNQAVILFIQILSELVIFKKVAGYRDHIGAD